MYIQKAIGNFFTQAGELNYNIIELFQQNPLGTTNFILFAAVVLFGPIFLYIFVKRSQANRIIDKVIASSTVDEYDQNFIYMIEQLELRTNKLFAKQIFARADIIKNRYLEFMNDVDMETQIIYFKSLSNKFEQICIADPSTKQEIKSYFSQQSLDIIEVDLIEHINKYLLQCQYTKKDVEGLYAIVAYANTLSGPEDILDTVYKKFKTIDLGNDIELVKFILALNSEYGLQLYKYCYDMLEKRFHIDEVMDIVVLECVYFSKYRQLAYDYVSIITDEDWLETLYENYFNKVNDAKLDLAFISNDLIDNESHKLYVQDAITANWQDVEVMDLLSHNKHIVNILGHGETRRALSRVDELNFMKQESIAEAKAQEAIEIATKALSIVEQMRGGLRP